MKTGSQGLASPGLAFIDSREKKKKLLQSTSSVTFHEATARTALAALSSWKENVLSLS